MKTIALGILGMAGLAAGLMNTAPASFAGGRAPLVCLSTSGTEIPADNSQVLAWKKSTPNHFTSRGHVTGTIVGDLPDPDDHEHFLIKIGDQNNDTIEVIYNREFGALPRITPGSQVEICGDYITSNKPFKYYPASPAGAILHWVHIATDPTRHPSGYVIIDGVTYGMQFPER